MTTLLALLAGMSITLLVVVYVMAGEEPAPVVVQSQEAVSTPPVSVAPESRYAKDPITGEWVDWDAELREIQSFGGLDARNPNAQPNLEDLLDEQAKARQR